MIVYVYAQYVCKFYVHNNLIGYRNVERMKNAKAKHTLDLTLILRKFWMVTGAPLDQKRGKRAVRVKFM